MEEYMVIPMEIMSHEQACQEYGIEILQHLLQLDEAHCGREDNGERYKDDAQRVEDRYYSTNTLENITMLNYYSLRKLIFDFIMCCHTKLRLSTPTLTLAFQVLDKYVHSAHLHTQMLKDRLTFQMLGVVALWVSSKFMDSKIRHPDLFTLVQLVSYNSASSSGNGGNGRDQVARREEEEQRLMGTMRGLELDILRGLDWCVSDIPTHDFFVDILLRRLEDEAAELGMEEINQIKYGAQMLCELACFYPHINKQHSVSEVAYASVFLIRSCLHAAREGSVLSTPVTTNSSVQGGLGGMFGHLEQKLFALFKNCYYALNQDSLFSLPFSFKLKYFPKLPQHYPVFLQSLLYCVSDAHQDTLAMFTTAKVKQHSKAMPPTPNTPSLSKMGKTHAMHNTAMLRQATVLVTSTTQVTHTVNAKRPRAEYETDDEEERINVIDKAQHTGQPLPASYPVKKKLHTELLFIESEK